MSIVYAVRMVSKWSKRAWRWSFFVVTLAMLSQCGKPAVCDGCFKGNTCVPFSVSSSSELQCGVSGATCTACPVDFACVEGVCEAMAERDAGALEDAGEPDAGLEDAGANDAGTADAGPLDAGDLDAGDVDGGDADAGAVDAGSADAGTDAGSLDAGFDAGLTLDAGPVQRIRLMAANLTAGNNQNYNVPSGDVAPGPGIRLMQGAQPDIVMVQEFRYGADNAAAMQQMTNLVLGNGASFHREVIDSPGDIPNGIMSRFPILATGEWQDSRITNRDYAWARIDIPGPKDLWAISVHFSTTATNRPIEGAEVVSNVMSMIPAGDFVVLGGDLNTDDVMEPVFTTLAQTFSVTPWPTDQFGNPGTNTNRLITLSDGGLDPMRNKPYDWVMPSPNLASLEVPVFITDGVNTLNLPNGLIIDTRVFDAGNIGLISPALLGDSAALNMQHMGVIRDFDIPY